MRPLLPIALGGAILLAAFTGATAASVGRAAAPPAPAAVRAPTSTAVVGPAIAAGPWGLSFQIGNGSPIRIGLPGPITVADPRSWFGWCGAWRSSWSVN